MFCKYVLLPFKVIVWVPLTVVTTVIEIVCNLVSQTITSVKKVCNNICKSLGPLSVICNWACKLVEVVETIQKWVCETLLKPVIQIVKLMVAFTFFIGLWICKILTQWLFWLLCYVGLDKYTLYVPIRVVVLTNQGEPVIQEDALMRLLTLTASTLAQCSLKLTLSGIAYEEKPEYISSLTCGAQNVFSTATGWFAQKSVMSFNLSSWITTTVFVVGAFADDKCGCSIPGYDFVVIAAPHGDNCLHAGRVLAHELGHSSGLPHSSNQQNLMWENSGTDLEKWQCCMLRSSSVATVIKIGEVV